MIFPLRSALQLDKNQLGFSLGRKVDVNLFHMTNSKGRRAQNQLVATQYSVVDCYAIDHVTHLMTTQQSDK